jgi:hypothetical protein
VLAVASHQAQLALEQIEAHFTHGMTDRERASVETVIDLDADENTCPACLEPFRGHPSRCPSCGLRIG